MSGYVEAIMFIERAAIEEKLNLQQDDGKAKPYQVRQVRFIIINYHLADEI